MKIQPISRPVCYSRQNVMTNKTKSINSNNVSFNGYSDVMNEALEATLNNRADVAKHAKNLFLSLIKEKDVVKKPIFDTVKDWLNTSAINFVEELCKPIAEVKSSLRDIVFDSKEDLLTVLEGPNDNEVFIVNLGKHGFWNNMFEIESARNDVRLSFVSNRGTFEVGTTKNGNLEAGQYFKTGSWQKSIFNEQGIKVKQKSGYSPDTPVWGGY